MTTEEKKRLIWEILCRLKLAQTWGVLNQDLDEGDTFFSLCFRSDKELITIGKAIGIEGI